ncbi:MAG: glycosyltransferase family 4 protein [Chloroflexaceae bacterium]|jgi:colanic acid biosynthesis glycosyl transferase WcaI|nr:glycosyltransferase family 4 protein [Chloroflexaceae bacterium]
MARVLLLSLVFAPDGVSTAVLMTELAQELQACGHELTVLTTTPHYNLEPEARARQPLRPYWGSLLQRSACGDMPVYHAAIPVKGSRVGARMLDYMRFHAVSTMAGLVATGRYDVVLAPSPPLTIGVSAWLLALARGVPFIYNVQEIYPDVAVSLGVLKNRRMIRALEGLERFVYGRARVVTVISEWFRRRLLAKGVPPEKLQVIPNFVDTDFMQPGSRQNEFAHSHGLDDTFVVLYAGNIGLTQGFETILAAARQLRHLPAVRFVVVGDGARRAWLEEQLRAQGLPNVLLLPYQPRSVVPQIYASSDVCLVPLKRGTAQETFPSKIYTIMAAGRPVIASADAESELAWVVGQAGCGWAVPPDDSAALVQAVSAAYHGRDSLSQQGRAGRTYVVAHHSRQAVARQYDELITRLCLGKPSLKTRDRINRINRIFYKNSED